MYKKLFIIMALASVSACDLYGGGASQTGYEPTNQSSSQYQGNDNAY